MKEQSTLNGYLRQAIIENWNNEALSNLHSETYLYRDLARKISKMHIMFEAAGLAHGDKIALCGKNSAEWTIAFLAVVTYGAVAVPILVDFKPDTIHHLVNHSGAKVLFADQSTWNHLDESEMSNLVGVVRIEDYALLMSRSPEVTRARHHLNELFGKRYPERFTPEDVKFAETKPSEPVLINYTAGSTGFSKGVILPERALWSNIQFCIDGLTFLKPGDPMLSLLPLAHMYGLMVEVIHPLVKGCHVFLLNRVPSPKILLDAFSTIRPKLIVAVPLVLEKIIKTRVFPTLEKPLMKFLLHLPGVRGKVLAKVKQKLIKAFGGNLLEMIIGGAGLSKDVESFLREIQFPVTVGYGMTECGPLISYAPWNVQRPGSCGRVVDRMEVKVDSEDPVNRPGVLWVRGMNVMDGYYNNSEATEGVMRDGWMNTGDICQIDEDGFIYIRGRDKNMILGPSGQNIYPEEIEQKINNIPFVNESIVIDDHGRLVALVNPDSEAAKVAGLTDPSTYKNALEEAMKEVNKELPSYSKVADFRIHKEEFEKTPKRSIKRYLYQPKD